MPHTQTEDLTKHDFIVEMMGAVHDEFNDTTLPVAFAKHLWKCYEGGADNDRSESMEWCKTVAVERARTLKEKRESALDLQKTETVEEIAVIGERVAGPGPMKLLEAAHDLGYQRALKDVGTSLFDEESDEANERIDRHTEAKNRRGW